MPYQANHCRLICCWKVCSMGGALWLIAFDRALRAELTAWLPVIWVLLLWPFKLPECARKKLRRYLHCCRRSLHPRQNQPCHSHMRSA